MFTKYANAIAIAARQGGGNPEANFKLRLAIESARSINMPKDNIQRAIDRGSGSSGASGVLEEVIYEGFAPFGVALVIEAVTDNRQRTSGQIRALLDKHGGSLAGPGATSFQFKKQGEIGINLEDKNAEEASLEVIDYGAEDVEVIGNQLFVYTPTDQLESVKNKLTEHSYVVASADLTMTPITMITITDKDQAQKILSLIEKIDELDDVLKVYANVDIPEEVVEAV